MDAAQRIRRHGYHLMSLASVGQLTCFILLLWNLGARHWNPHLATTLAHPAEWAFFVALAVAVWLSQCWTLARLRAIGRLLHSGVGISHTLADAWMRLGHALVVTAVLMDFPLVPGPTAEGEPGLVLRFDAGSLYFVAIGCLCIFSIARLLEQAATLRDENESIV